MIATCDGMKDWLCCAVGSQKLYSIHRPLSDGLHAWHCRRLSLPVQHMLAQNLRAALVLRLLAMDVGRAASNRAWNLGG